MTKYLDKRHWFLVIMTFSVYVVYAFYVNLFGADATVMMGFYQINSAQQGFILTMQSVGGFICSVFLALMGERFNKIYVVALGTLIMGASSVLIGFAPSYVILVVLVTIAGIGFTGVDIMVNGVITEVYPHKKSTLLPITHAFYGLGAMVGPLFVTLMVNPKIMNTFRIPFLWIGLAACVIFLLYVIAGKKVMRETPYAHMEEMKKRATENPAEIFKTKEAWILLVICVFQFIYQFGMSSWLPTYCIEVRGMPFDTAGLVLTGFFAGALIMRFLSPFFLRKMSAAAVFSGFSIASAVSMIIAFSVPYNPVMIVLVVIAGFFQGANAVTLVMMCCAVFPKRTASASAIQVFAVNIGIMISPLVIGKMAQTTGFALPLYLAAALMVVPIVLTRIMMKKHACLREVGK
ncbi:MAG: MFS transporter [Christensenella sp.]|nr:MFS transporter [Christensenella sp.]